MYLHFHAYFIHLRATFDVIFLLFVFHADLILSGRVTLPVNSSPNLAVGSCLVVNVITLPPSSFTSSPGCQQNANSTNQCPIQVLGGQVSHDLHLEGLSLPYRVEVKRNVSSGNTTLTMRISYSLNVGWCQHNYHEAEVLRAGDFYNDTELEVSVNQQHLEKDVQLTLFEGRWIDIPLFFF